MLLDCLHGTARSDSNGEAKLKRPTPRVTLAHAGNKPLLHDSLHINEE